MQSPKFTTAVDTVAAPNCLMVLPAQTSCHVSLKHGGRELVYSLANKNWLMQSHSPDGATVASGSTEAVQQHVTAAEMMLCGCEFLFFLLEADCLFEKQDV